MIFCKYSNEDNPGLLNYISDRYDCAIETFDFEEDELREGDLILGDPTLMMLYKMSNWNMIVKNLVRFAFIKFQRCYFVDYRTSMRSRMEGSHIREFRLTFGEAAQDVADCIS